MKSRSSANGAQDEAFRQRVRLWAKTIRVKPKWIRLQAMRHKWASCSSLGIVSFNRDLVRQTPSFQNAVIVHELVHLCVPNHGRLFKRLVAAHLAHRS